MGPTLKKNSLPAQLIQFPWVQDLGCAPGFGTGSQTWFCSSSRTALPIKLLETQAQGVGLSLVCSRQPHVEYSEPEKIPVCSCAFCLGRHGDKWGLTGLLLFGNLPQQGTPELSTVSLIAPPTHKPSVIALQVRGITLRAEGQQRTGSAPFLPSPPGSQPQLVTDPPLLSGLELHFI